MPVYGTPQAGGLTALAPGESMKLFDAETPAASTASIPFARAISASQDDAGTTFTISFAAAPTSTLSIQGSNVDVDAQYQQLFLSTSKQFDFYTDIARFAFYRAKLLTQTAGGAVTVIAQR